MRILKKLIRQFGLRERYGPGGKESSGTFHYFDISTSRKIEFRWDGAAIDKDGYVIIFEEELNSITNLHIHGHLSRLIIMIIFGEKIRKLIWIVKKNEYKILKRVVETWITFFKPINIKLPYIEYRTPNGDLLI